MGHSDPERSEGEESLPFFTKQVFQLEIPRGIYPLRMTKKEETLPFAQDSASGH
jgi:hypothetical protein